MTKMKSILLIVATISTACFAHFPWIHADRFVVNTDKTIGLFVGWGHGFPFGSFADTTSISNHQIIAPDGSDVPASFKTPFEYKTDDRQQVEGIYMLGAVRDASYYSKTTTGGRRGNRATITDATPISCGYTHTYMKALVKVGNGGDGALGVLGHDLEIILEKDPSTLQDGESLPFTVLFNNEPLSVTVNATWHGHIGEEEFVSSVTTNDQGKGSIVMNNQGIWLFEAVYETPYPDEEVCDVEKYRAVFTFPFMR